MTTTKLPELPDIKWLTLDNIDAIDRKRSLNRDVIDRLKDSIARIGLKTPLSVRFISQDQNWRLVTGHHRLQACIELGMEWVPVHQEEGSELGARMWELSENLHRAELTLLEYAQHLAEWIKLANEREKVTQFASPGGRQPASKGIRAAARELGITQRQAQRALNRTKHIAPEVQDEISNMPEIADSGVELDALANAQPDKQTAAVFAVKSGDAKTVREVLTPETAIRSDYKINHILKRIAVLTDAERAALWSNAVDRWRCELQLALAVQ